MTRPSLRTIFVLSAILVILVTSGTAAYISYVNAGGAVRSVTTTLHREVATRVVEHLRGFLEVPHFVLEQNARLIATGHLLATDQKALQRVFLEQVALPSAITSLYFGNPEGGLAGAGHGGRRAAFYTIGTEGFVAGPFRKVAVTPDGQGGGEMLSLPGYDARNRPWYMAALDRDGGVWGDIYLLFTGHDLALPPSRAVRDSNGRLLGVIGTDMFLSHIGRFLTGLHADVPGVTYIMERSGLLVAASTGEAPFHTDAMGRATDRLVAVDSAWPEVALSARLILSGDLWGDGRTETRGQGRDTDTARLTTVVLDGVRQTITVTPFEDPRGLAWLIATVVPTAAYEEPIAAANLRTMVLTLLAMAMMAALSAMLIRRTLAPLAGVVASAQAVGHGDLTRRLPDHGNNEIGVLARAFNDMVARLRAAQAQQARQMAELADAEGRFRTLFQSAEVAIFNEDFTEAMADLDRLRASGVTDLRAHLRAHPEVTWRLVAGIRVIECNDATGRMLGVEDLGDLLGPIDRYLEGDSIGVMVDELCAIWEGRSEYRSEIVLRTRSGERRIFLFSLPIPETRDGFRNVPVSFVDVTERKRAEEALRHKNAELERSNADLASFAHVAAHDLREPLRTVASYATLLGRRLGDRLTPDEAEFLGYIHEGALRMDALISDLLEFARVGRGAKPFAAVPLRAVADQAVTILRARLDLAGADIAIAPDLPVITGNADDLVRVFANLIDNAVKYCRPDDPLRVVIGAARMPATGGDPAASWRVFVRDNGIGLPPGQGYEQRIFGLFQRLHARDAHGGGTGIGLAICKKVIEQHGGRIWADSPGENQGCTIHFTLPAG